MRIVEAAFFSGAIFLGVLACLRIGWSLGRARLRAGGEDSMAGLGALEGSIYALMGLLIAFTFTGAAQRFESRRDLIVQEVNAIGTAWLRLDLLDTETRDDVRALFRQYLDVRIEGYARIGESAAVASALAESNKLQNAIWSRLAAAAQQNPTPQVAAVVLPPVNEMFDVANTRLLATHRHPPIAIFLMLGFLVLVSALMAGFGMAKAQSQSSIHAVGFAAIVSVAIYLIIDLEFPRLGLLRVDDFDQAFVQLRQSME
jgi:AcrR family transcriptional regulator